MNYKIKLQKTEKQMLDDLISETAKNLTKMAVKRKRSPRYSKAQYYQYYMDMFRKAGLGESSKKGPK